MSNKNFYWFSGDRYLSLFGKKRLLEKLSKDGEKWDIQNVSELNADKIYSVMLNIPLFGAANIAYVHDGNLPDADRMCSFLQRLQNNRAFILITDKVNKNSKLYKNMKNRLKFFDNDIEKNKNILKKIATFWNGSDEVFDFVYKNCRYDTGETMSELEKISIYFNGQKVSEISDIKRVFYGSLTPHINDIFDNIQKGRCLESLTLLNLLLEKEAAKTYAFTFFYTMIEKILKMDYSQSEALSKMLRTARSSIDDVVESRGKQEYLMKKFVHHSCLYF